MSFCWTSSRKSSPTLFSQFSDDFYLNTEGHLCKKDIPKDDQAVIDSYFETRLEAILDLYSDTIDNMLGYSSVEFSDDIVEIDNNRNKLDQILAVDQILAEYASSDPANAGLSREALISKMQKSYAAAVAEYQSKLKGDNKDAEEKETEPEGE